MSYELRNSIGLKKPELDALRNRFRQDPSTANLVRHIMAKYTEIYGESHPIMDDIFCLTGSQTQALAGWWPDQRHPISDEALDRLMLVEIQSRRHLWDVDD